MPKTNGKSSDLCNEDGCFSPRFQTPKHRYQKCETHMRETWRKYAANDDADSPPRRERPAARKSVSTPPLYEVERGLGGEDNLQPALAPICSLCRRSPHQAAHFALYVNTWCVACTPMSVSRDDLLRRVLPDFSAPVPAPAPEVVQPANNSAEIDNLRAQLAAAQREIRVLQQAINSPAQPEGDFKILVMDFEESCVRYLTGRQQRSESLPSTREEMTSFQLNAARDGYILARRHTNKALETL